MAASPPVLIRYESKYSFVKQAKKADAKVKPIAQTKVCKVEGINLFYGSLYPNKRFHNFFSDSNFDFDNYTSNFRMMSTTRYNLL